MPTYCLEAASTEPLRVRNPTESSDPFKLRRQKLVFTETEFLGQNTGEKGSPGGSEGEESDCNARDPGLNPGLGRAPGEGNGYPLQYSCLGNPVHRGAWWATVHGVAKSRTRLSNSTTTTEPFKGMPEQTPILFEEIEQNPARFNSQCLTFNQKLPGTQRSRKI